MNKIDTVIQGIAKLSAPSKTKQVKLEKISKEIQKEIESFRDSRISRVQVGGSFAKGTWLENYTDIDFFVMISSTVEREEFEQLGKSIGFQVLKNHHPYLRYSEHPYVEGQVDGIRVNIVPCYKVEKNMWKSAADRSPFHTEFMQDHLNDFLRGQVRVLKKFLKSIGVYGSQIAISGFSGYVTEVLILKYRSFKNVVQTFAELSPNYVVSMALPKQETLAKFTSPLIIIDPVDPRRNLGAAISHESVTKFVLASRNFLKDPSRDFFTNSFKLNPKIIMNIKSNLLIIDFKIQKRSPDILWGQLKRKLSSISRQLGNAGFKIIKKYCFTDEQQHAVLIFLIEFPSLSKIKLIVGPEMYFREETDSFIKKRANKSMMMWTDKMRIASIEKRKILSIKEQVRIMIQNEINSESSAGITLDLKNGYSVYLAHERRLSVFVTSAIYNMVLDGEFIRRLQ